MRSGRLIPTFIALVLISLGQGTHADAGWGFGQGWGWRTGGLNLDHGYDVNTVVSITGRIVALTVKDERHTFAEVRTGDETIYLVLGPQWYWSEHGIAIRPNDRITAWGSKARDEDGATYILAQRIVNQITGAEVVLRSETGRPVWAGGGRQGRQSSRGPR